MSSQAFTTCVGGSASETAGLSVRPPAIGQSERGGTLDRLPVFLPKFQRASPAKVARNVCVSASGSGSRSVDNSEVTTTPARRGAVEQLTSIPRSYSALLANGGTP
jgi:hypothetical protein